MDWDLRYKNKDTPWDKGRPAPLLQELLEKRKVLFDNVHHALVPGCGAGYDSYLLAQHGIRTTGLDISERAITKAAKLHQHELLDWNVGDLFTGLNQAQYDMVWEHTCFCAISPDTRDAYVASMAHTLKPHGFLLGIFFIATEPICDQGPPYKTSIDIIKSHFFKHFTLEYQLTPEVHYPDRIGQEQLMLFRRLDCCLD